MTSTNDIRRAFLDYFGREGHQIVPSAPLVPQNDPTLMFVNAGMVPFKNVFTGLETRPYTTAASSQKCVRAGGKHNDLDNVGYTARHHTFFEMLGNFSFGDYFKERAIGLAWDLMTSEWGISPDRLTATVYHTDDEAFDLWRKIAGLPEEPDHPHPDQGQFLGDGRQRPVRALLGDLLRSWRPYSRRPARLARTRTATASSRSGTSSSCNMSRRTNEIVRDLPRPSIDTGMGLERIAAVLQGVHDNYDTDTFKALIAASAELTRTDAGGERKASHRVIADHLRASGFLIADGVLPANEGRGYVLRRIMRRAMRHAHLLGAAEPLMHRLVPALVAEMGAAYPELVRAQPLIEETLKLEETRFRQTLANGLRLLDEATAGDEAGRHACRARSRSSSTTRSASPTTSPRTRCAPRASASTAPASTPPWPSRRPPPAPPGRARARRRRTTSGSTSPRSRARPSSPAMPAMKARARSSRWSRTARASSAPARATRSSS